MGKGSGISRAERRRNARKEHLRGLLPRDGAVVGIDLGEDKQALCVVDHDVRVLWRKTARVQAHRAHRRDPLWPRLVMGLTD